MMKNDLQHPRLVVNILALLTFMLILFGGIGSSHAMSFDVGKDATLHMDTNLKYEAAWRLKDPSSKLNTIGNNNFDKGDMIANKFSALMDIEFIYKNMGAFARPRAHYDFVYDDKKFVDDTKDVHRDNAEFLDYYVFGDFKIGGRFLTLRVGNQVVSWGENLFVSNGISSAQSALDLTAATSPDVELKDLFLPNGQIFAKLDLVPGWSISGYYAYEYEKTRMMEMGSYWSFADIFLDAGIDIPIVDLGPPGVVDIDRIKDDNAADHGQWGFALRYIWEELNETEFGFYVLNYHEKLPHALGRAGAGNVDVGTGDPVLDFLDGAGYYMKYPENVRLYGLSVSAAIGDWNVSGEASYRVNRPVEVVDATSPLGVSLKDADMLQAQVSFIRVFPIQAYVDDIAMVAEVGYNRVYKYAGADLNGDEFAWGGVLQMTPSFYQIASGLDLAVPITYTFNPNGSVPIGVSTPFTESMDNVGIKFNFTYRSNYQFSIGYATYFGGESNNVHDDRDNVSIAIKYSF